MVIDIINEQLADNCLVVLEITITDKRKQIWPLETEANWIDYLMSNVWIYSILTQIKQNIL